MHAMHIHALAKFCSGCAVFEDIPMSVLSVLWLINVGGTPSPMVLISMMMGAGMVRIHIQ
jgi:hypothetical protein